MDEAGPTSAITRALDELRQSAGLEGAAVLDCADPDGGPVALYTAGPRRPLVLFEACRRIRAGKDGPAHGVDAERRPVLACPWTLPPHGLGGLVLWREPGGRSWRRADYGFGSAVAGVIRVMLEHSPDESGLDRLTGLPNRLWFLDEADRHIERLTRDQVPGTLMLVGLDEFDHLTKLYGVDAGNWLLTRMAAMLRAAVRPWDLVARTGVDEFAVWLPGMDHMTAAERAETLCARRLTLPAPPGHGVITAPTVSVGIACRAPRSAEDIRALIGRAREAALRVREDGGGGWHVSH